MRGMDAPEVAVRASLVVWWRRLILSVVLLLLPGTAYGQAPPQSFYDGRSNDDLRALASNPRNDILLRRGAATKLVIALADAGDFDAADAAAMEFARTIDPAAAKHARAVRRRSKGDVVALASLAAALGVAVVSLVAARRSLAKALGTTRRVATPVALFLLYSGVIGGYLASSYENGSSLPFVLFAGFMLPLVVIFRTWGVVGSPRVAARAARAFAAVAATLALAFLVVEHVNPAYLEGFGL